jgi:iron complex transport system substrate-binding protein
MPSRRTLLLGLGAVALSACARRVPSAAAGRRVVSIAPSTTEAVFALGAGADLVGRSRHCDHPAEAAVLPVVGGYADPSVEAIVALTPTLVIGARGPAGPALEQTLHAHGIETYFPETESIGQIEAMLQRLGELLGRPADAERLLGAMRGRIAEVEASVHGRARPRAIMLFDVTPIVAAGPGSFPDELLRRAGADNVIVRGGAYPTIGIEHLLALDPDVLLDGISDGGVAVGQGRVASLRNDPGWRDLRAMRAGAVRAIDSSAVLRPGPRIGDGLAALARAVHGPSSAASAPSAR